MDGIRFEDFDLQDMFRALLHILYKKGIILPDELKQEIVEEMKGYKSGFDNK